ncbi:MAG: efflux RND transporter periplasmic adaptor subunit [Gammaproteobacteria bacterium]|nr:efflux RND transporter periplasmic adaptor subunit [Gammaproteobacteria bacterium]
MNPHIKLVPLVLLGLAGMASADPPIGTARVELHQVPREYRLDGRVEAVNRTTITAQTRGQVEEILFDVDEYVEEGALILRLKSTEQQATLTQAEADLKAANAHLQEVRDDYQRIKEVFRKQLVSQSEMDRASTALKAGWAKQEAAAAQLRQASEQFEYTRVRAPYSGIVTDRHIEIGEIANPGQPLISGISLARLRVRVQVPQSLIPGVRKGGTVHIKHPTLGDIPAEKVTVFPYADEQSSTFTVRLDLPPGTGELFPGMFVKTVFAIGESTQLTIPAASVVFRGEVTGVYVVGDDNSIALRHIRIGAPTAIDRRVVISGLDEGESVALDPVAAGALLKQRLKVRADD